MKLELLIAGLTLLGAISPLLTFAAFFQIKEWRFDRLRSFLQEEGMQSLYSIFGKLRPALIALTFITAYREPLIWPFLPLFLLAALSGAQLVLRKQRYPVWTQKAKMISILSLGLTGLATMLCTHPDFFHLVFCLPFLILLQPFIVSIALLLLLPLDAFLKRRVMNRARLARDRFSDITVIGITGSVGKTTTKELLAHILEGPNTLVTPAHVNTEMGVSQWLTRELSKRDPDHPLTLIIEMGAYRLGEIANLCSIVKPTMGVITFIGTQHISLFGSQENLLNAKSELIASLPENGHAFLNADNAFFEELRTKTSVEITSVGTGGHADSEAFDIEEKANGISFRIEDTRFDVPLNGTHNVTNVLLAIETAKKTGMTPAHIASRLHSFSPPQKTFNVRTEGSITLLDDTHNSSQASAKAGITWAKSHPSSHKTLLMTGLIELGTEQERVHTELGALATDIFDRIVFIHEKQAQQFQKGCGKHVEILGKTSGKVPNNSLVVCIGRMSEKQIQKLLPT